MLVITHQRPKCIGCNGCVEAAPGRWAMSKKDGKAVLLGGKTKKQYSSVRVSMVEHDENQKAAAACPVNIISLKVV